MKTLPILFLSAVITLSNVSFYIYDSTKAKEKLELQDEYIKIQQQLIEEQRVAISMYKEQQFLVDSLLKVLKKHDCFKKYFPNEKP